MVFGIERLRGNHLLNAVTAASSIGFFLFGYNQGVLAGLISSDGFTNQFRLTADVNGKSVLKYWKWTEILNTYELGCILGAVFILFRGEAIGRRVSIIIGTCVLMVGAALQASATGVPQIVIGRIISGFGNGVNTATISVYSTEFSSPKNRGRDIAFGQAMFVAGISLSYWLEYGLSFTDVLFVTCRDWNHKRFPIVLQTLFALVLVFMLLDLPESPRWLLAQGRTLEARIVLARLTSNYATPTDAIVISQSKEIEDAITREGKADTQFKYMELFQTGAARNSRRIYLCFSVQMMQQFIGVNLIATNMITVFTSIGLSQNFSRLLAGINTLEYLAAALIFVLIIDKVGRRRSLMCSSGGCSASLLVLGTLLATGATENKARGGAAASMTFIFNTFFAIGWLAVPWLYPAEICTLRLRSKGVAIGAIANWVTNWILAQVPSSVIQGLGWKAYIMFGINNAVVLGSIYHSFPETALKPLESSDTIFSAHDKNNIGTGEDLLSRSVTEASGNFEDKAVQNQEEIVAL